MFMNKFEILNDLRLIEDLNSWTRYEIVKNDIEYCFNHHSTGEGINIYLLDGDKEKLHVFYDYNWFSSRYLFNEEGKKHGYLIDDAPFNKVIEKQFSDWEIKIVAHKAKIAAAELNEKFDKLEKENALINKFKVKYAENAGDY